MMTSRKKSDVFVFSTAEWTGPNARCCACLRTMRDGDPYSIVSGTSLAMRLAQKLYGPCSGMERYGRFLVCCDCGMP